MKQNLILAAIGLTVFVCLFFVFQTIGESVLSGFPKLKGEASDLALSGSLTMTLIVLMIVYRAFRKKD